MAKKTIAPAVKAALRKLKKSHRKVKLSAAAERAIITNAAHKQVQA